MCIPAVSWMTGNPKIALAAINALFWNAREYKGCVQKLQLDINIS